jgi:ornithine decarboxylase
LSVTASAASAANPEATSRPAPTARIEAFIRAETRETPYLVVDLDVVRERYRRLDSALPDTELFYAVKANPAPEILELLVREGCQFDVASPGEIDMALAAGAEPAQLSYGNTMKKRSDIAYAVERGVRYFAFDAVEELDKITEVITGGPRIVDPAEIIVFCRILCDGAGSDWPLSRKFGCDVDQAVELLLRAADAGLGLGVCFHVGSQQRNPGAWRAALGVVAEQIAAPLAEAGHRLDAVNIGGGFPGSYLTGVPSPEEYGAVIDAAVTELFGPEPPRLIAEPGRYLVADAGVIETEVVLVARKSIHDQHRWVYLDIGLFGGLAECLGEAIKYPIRTPYGPAAATGPVVIAGPTCDSADVLYEEHKYQLPLALTAGDRVQLISTGAYTTTYSAVAFNGFPPLPAYYLPLSGEAS